MENFPTNPSRLLVILAAGLGDLVIAAPVLKALRRTFRRARITLAVSPKALDYARLCPYADEAVALDGRLGPAPDTWQWLRTIAALRRERFDLALNLYEISTVTGMLKMRALMAAISPGVSAGRDTDGRGSFYTLRSPDSPKDGINHGEHYARLAALVGCEVRPEEKSALWIGAEAEKSVSAFLESRGLPPGAAFFGVHPGAQRSSRFWLPERFAQTADALARANGLKAVILGGPGEEGLARNVASLMKSEPVIAAGLIGFEQSLDLFRRMRLLVATHSSLMHAANAFDVPCVALCGISDMLRDGPYRPAPGRFAVVKGEDATMRSISSGAVISAAQATYDSVYGKDKGSPDHHPA